MRRIARTFLTAASSALVRAKHVLRTKRVEVVQFAAISTLCAALWYELGGWGIAAGAVVILAATVPYDARRS